MRRPPVRWETIFVQVFGRDLVRQDRPLSKAHHCTHVSIVVALPAPRAFSLGPSCFAVRSSSLLFCLLDFALLRWVFPFHMDFVLCTLHEVFSIFLYTCPTFRGHIGVGRGDLMLLVRRLLIVRFIPTADACIGAV